MCTWFRMYVPQNTQSWSLLFFFLWVVSPYAVVEAGCKAQPAQIGCQEHRGGAADGIPGHHGGSDSPREKHNLNEGLKRTERGHVSDSDVYNYAATLTTPLIIGVQKKKKYSFKLNLPISACVHQRKWESRPNSELAVSHKARVELVHRQWNLQAPSTPGMNHSWKWTTKTIHTRSLR